MKLNDYDRGAPSICRASIVTRLVILQSYSQLLKKKKKKSGSKVRDPEFHGSYGNVDLLRPGSFAS